MKPRAPACASYYMHLVSLFFCFVGTFFGVQKQKEPRESPELTWFSVSGNEGTPNWAIPGPSWLPGDLVHSQNHSAFLTENLDANLMGTLWTSDGESCSPTTWV